MTRVLVTGANGFLGSAVAARLSAAGHQVRGVTRAETGALSATTDWHPHVADMDAVIHCAARAHVLRDDADDPMAAFRSVNRDATLALARAATQAGVRRIVFISTIGVNGGQTSGRPFRHNDTPAPHSPYAIAKHEAEVGLAAIARDTGLEVVTIRPPLILGKSPKGNLASLLGVMRRGLPLPLGAVTRNRRDLVSCDTLVSLIETCLDHPNAAGKVFLASDGVSRSTRAICAALARMNGVTARFIPIPPALLGLGLKALGKAEMAAQLLGDLEVDIRHTRDTLGWHPPSQAQS